MKNDNSFDKLGDLFNKKKEIPSPPAYRWQDLALSIIKELNIPDFKKSSVFKACRDNSREFIERCLNDTKELCDGKDKWRYFFKLVSSPNTKKDAIDKKT
ncbi:hypothetical protein K8R62_02500 [bacterium]|nr:hypothetical protein [bacterium]